MGRTSSKKDKTLYQEFREEMGYTREKASEVLESISAERIERIENEKSLPHPDEVLAMSVAYQKPRLCNHYCANTCPIGQEYVPEIQVKNLSEMVLGLLASLNNIQKWKDRLIEITADGEIGGEEIAPKAELVTKELMEKWRNAGLGVRAWGVSSIALMKKMCCLGVDGMTVNFPDRLREFLK